MQAAACYSCLLRFNFLTNSNASDRYCLRHFSQSNGFPERSQSSKTDILNISISHQYSAYKRD